MKCIIRAYEYFFYKLYHWSVKVYGEEYYHKYSASLMVSAVFILNTFTLLIILDVLVGTGIQELSAIHGLTIALGCILFNYFYFSFKDRYLQILNRYKGESEVSNKRGNLVVTLCVIGSLLLMILSGFLGSYING